ncbi:MAG: formate dehydrogenase subunit alpha [Bacteroidetes bacterium GWC2_33_15]|nr:MAG: formate dehydrogenase subunit alpha [Bacteroidetes bacterium GWA2_33_15]OFX49561.1 MAG: formate dehydrogenase subunit alpha [Bacteroidetes bacterium GWC2_33_15]OFX63600.1 MAG: formate dehydrogenase subunit alpha [Bacteroidetes bacterium GWB2_32_14]OFX68813.1 MAG: formate dehydrogenase subunit alpha [Bacteroidetes bacterium GWD2_33_33]HAN17594.1 formate dehydrogenase subunit alpha [Bacteroidales bacterium]
MSKIITIKIDGKIIQTTEGSNLLQVAHDNEIHIPSLCYHKKLTPTGACRLCVTKINGTNGLVMSCTVSVKEGMEVIAFDNELEETRKHTLDYLLAEHNGIYDGAYIDEFREWVKLYGLDDPKNRKYLNINKELNYKTDDSSPILTYDATKCIKCFRCIKGCDEIQGKNVLSFSERGITSYIIAGLDKWNESECDGCGECVQLCPTGALVEKPHRQEIQLEKIEKKVRTTCPYCGVGCQLELYIQDGKIVRSNGVEGILPNNGRLCVKGRFGYDFVSSPKRLTKPLIKKNGEFVEAEWDEALHLIASKFLEIKQKYGNDALAGYASAKCTNEDNYIFQKFTRQVFGTNNIDYCTRLCHASTVTAMLKSIGDGAGSNSIEDFATTDCLFVTGNNMIETHPVTATYVKNGKYKGQKLIVCDPKWTPLVRYADIWLQPRLGTDVALLNGMIHIIIKEDLIKQDFIKNRVDGSMEAFYELKNLVKDCTPEKTEEITSVPKDKLIAAARMYATAETSMIATGMGMSQQVTGTNNVFALINMMLITGQIGKERAGIDPPRGQNNVQGATDVGCSPVFYPGYIPVINDENRKRVAKIWNIPYENLSAKPGLTTVEIMHAAHEGKIKALYIMGENPMLTDPDLNHTEHAIKKLGFLVVQDIFHTETTPYADVILPASSFAEKDGTFVNSDRRVLRVRKAVELPGEAREDWKIVVAIAEKMGYNIGKYTNAAEIFDEIAQAAPMMAGISYNRIEKQGIQWPCPTKDHPGTSTLFLEKFNTPNGKAKLNPVQYIPQSEQASNEFPFVLNSGRILYHYHTATMSRKNKSLTDFANESYVLMNPGDAVKFGFIDGEKVRVSSKQGKLETTLNVSDQVADGELFMPWHYSESPVNRLTRSDLDPFSRIAAFKLTACKVEKI